MNSNEVQSSNIRFSPREVSLLKSKLDKNKYFKEVQL